MSAERFWREVTGDGRAECWARSLPGADRWRCDGPLDAHHLIPQRLLRRELSGDPRLDAYLHDPRNGVPVCRQHHHVLETRALVVPRRFVPRRAAAFAEELGLVWALDRACKPTDRREPKRASEPSPQREPPTVSEPIELREPLIGSEPLRTREPRIRSEPWRLRGPS